MVIDGDTFFYLCSLSVCVCVHGVCVKITSLTDCCSYLHRLRNFHHHILPRTHHRSPARKHSYSWLVSSLPRLEMNIKTINTFHRQGPWLCVDNRRGNRKKKSCSTKIIDQGLQGNMSHKSLMNGSRLLMSSWLRKAQKARSHVQS